MNQPNPTATLPTQYQQFIHLSRYARWDYDKKRRETWGETVDRYFLFFQEHLKEMCDYSLDNGVLEELRKEVLALNVMPSMRCLMTAGDALRKENVAGYNCSYVKVDSPRSFDEILYVLMNGTGVGFSVEAEYVNHLPVIAEEFHPTDTTIVVADSKLGWAKAFKELLSLLWTGQIPKWDLTKVREAGKPLKTFGGRASGPEPLDDLFHFSTKMFQDAAGRKLKPIEAHDIVCKIAEIVVVGGVRRRTYMREWLSLYDSKSGERGIYNGLSAKNQVMSLNEKEPDGQGGFVKRREPRNDFGTNPCSEIILRSREFCNLSECVIRRWDTPESLSKKVRTATILGTFQSTLTNFRYLTKEWERNCADERLLGVSLTGILDNPYTNGKKKGLENLLEDLRKVAYETNKEWADKLGIKRSAAITCVKPSGTVSQLVDSASGIHARHNPYYIRTIRADNKDPLCKMMKEANFPNEPDVTKPEHTTVFSFPMESPKDAICRKDMTAIEQLQLWTKYQEHWCEHKPSITVSVKEHEWFDVGAWVWNNFDSISGISFLPFSEHTYRQAPYQDCTKQEYDELFAKIPQEVDWSKLSNYEQKDYTVASQELACSADGGCEIVDL